MKLKCLVVSLVLLAGLGMASGAEATNLACYIDTPAYDVFRANACFAVGMSPSVAVFKVQNVNTSLWDIYWSESSCTTNSIFCTIGISPGQQKTVTAYLWFRPEPEGAFTYSATAYYEGYW